MTRRPNGAERGAQAQLTDVKLAPTSPVGEPGAHRPGEQRRGDEGAALAALVHSLDERRRRRGRGSLPPA